MTTLFEKLEKKMNGSVKEKDFLFYNKKWIKLLCETIEEEYGTKAARFRSMHQRICKCVSPDRVGKNLNHCFACKGKVE